MDSSKWAAETISNGKITPRGKGISGNHGYSHLLLHLVLRLLNASLAMNYQTLIDEHSPASM
jgi:hypothetical protein